MSEERKKAAPKNSRYSGEPSFLFDTAKRRIDLYEPKRSFLQRIEAIERKLDQIIQTFQEKGEPTSQTMILDNADFIQLFKISAKTAQNWRDEGLVEYCQVKGKIFYRLEDVEKLLNRSRR